MSAYVVSRSTIDAIVQAAIQYGAPSLDGIRPKARPDELGKYLLRANMDSVRTRYGHVTYEYTAHDYDPQTMLGCIECYKYQVCGLTECDKTQLPSWLANLGQKIGTRRQFQNQGLQIPWGI